MAHINLATSIKRDPLQVFSKIDNEVIMLSLKEGNYHSLNEVGARIWELIEQSIDVNTLVSTLLKEYNISNSICEKETLDLLNDLYEQGLIILC